jgi:hypothetical protein
MSIAHPNVDKHGHGDSNSTLTLWKDIDKQKNTPFLGQALKKETPHMS